MENHQKDAKSSQRGVAMEISKIEITNSMFFFTCQGFILWGIINIVSRMNFSIRLGNRLGEWE